MSLDNQPPSKGELPQATFDELAETMEDYIQRAARRDIRMSVSLQNGSNGNSSSDYQVVSLGEQRPTFAANHAKLAVAAFCLVQKPEDRDTRRDVLSMLQISDNGAFIRQKRGVEQEINEYARQEALISTDILTIREDESSIEGMTTALDSMKLLIHLRKVAQQVGAQDQVNGAMHRNTSKYGVKNAIKPVGSGVRLLNKTGEYYGQDDPEVNEAVHHDVGIMASSHRLQKQRLIYSVTTSADTRLAAVRAELINHQVGASLVEALGGTIRMSLGVVAGRFITR